MQNALDLNIYGSETDVWITSDGCMMVNHDATFNGVRIETATAAKAQSLTLSNGEKMPTLEEFLEMMQASDSPTKLIIEIKTHSYASRNLAAADSTVNMVRRMGLQDRVEYIAFSLDICKRLVQNDPDACIVKVEAALDYPIFVKPANAGSSVGVSKAADREQLIKAIEIAAKEDRRILFEETIVGKEVECAVIGNSETFASVPGQIAPAAEFYDYDAKYNNAASQLFIPAQISDELKEIVRRVAVRAYRALDCTGLARVDFFVTDGGRVLLNEINTMPGFTSISMYPKLMAACDIKGSALIERLIELAYERAEKNV